MRNCFFIFLLVAATTVSSSCEPAKQGGYEAPSKGNEGQIEGDVYSKIDSSIEKAVANDTTKREYHL